MIAALVMTDGRDAVLDKMMAAWAPVLEHDLVTEHWFHDDTGDDGHRFALTLQYPAFGNLALGRARAGFGGAIQHAWRQLARTSAARYVLHLEDDFTPAQPIDLAAMIRTLDEQPHLTQVALRRQPWNEAEHAAGGVVEQHPDDYVEVRDGEAVWLEHRRFWTTNPSLYRRSLCERGWPSGTNSEGRFGVDLFASDPALRSAFWGARDSGVWVEHIGNERVGTGY